MSSQPESSHAFDDAARSAGDGDASASPFDTGEFEAEALDAPGGVAPVPNPAPVMYALDGSHITLRECLWESKFVGPIGWLVLKVAGKHMPASTDDLPVESLAPLRVEEHALPRNVVEAMLPAIAELEQLGFHTPVWHALDDVINKTVTVMVTLGHRNGAAIARVHRRVWLHMNPPRLKQFFEFITGYEDNTYVWSLSGKADMRWPDSCTVVRKVGASAAELWRLHQEAVGAQPAWKKRLRVSTGEDAAAVAERLHGTVAAFHVRRGVFRPPTVKQVHKSEQARKELAQVAATGAAYPDVMLEVEKLEKAKAGWVGTIVLLLVSLAVFIGVGFTGMSWGRLLALVLVLFFHEAGHYLAMRVFGYRNVRMFFIPGLGAAVHGRHYNVPGWKKAVVSLMGPVPGILVGMVLGFAGMALHARWAVDAAMMLMLLNGFNLIPILPLDGGHVVHTVLFSRNSVLEVAFRIIAVVALLGVGVALGGRGFIPLIVIMVLGIPSAIRVSKAVKALKAEGLQPASDDNQTIPRDTAERIITKLREGSVKPQHPKMLAMQTLQVFETLNTRPPGWLASISLLGVQAGSFAIALVLGLVFAFAQGGAISKFMNMASHQPRFALEAADVKNAPGTGTSGVGGDGTVVATYPTATEARNVLARVQGKLGTGEIAAAFGNTVFVKFDPKDDTARKAWLAELEGRGAEVFVESAEMQAAYTFQTVARTMKEAEAIEKELNEYLGLPIWTSDLTAPWSPTGAPGQSGIAARQTLKRLNKAHADSWASPEIKEINRKMAAARKSGDKGALTTLQAEYEAARKATVKSGLVAVATDTSAGLDTDMANQYIELWERVGDEKVFEESNKLFAPRLGLVADADKTAAKSGWVNRAGVLLDINVRFADPVRGPTAMAKWLDEHGCRHQKYEVYGEEPWNDEMD